MKGRPAPAAKTAAPVREKPVLLPRDPPLPAAQPSPGPGAGTPGTGPGAGTPGTGTAGSPGIVSPGAGSPPRMTGSTRGIAEGVQKPPSFRGLFKAIDDANFIKMKLIIDQGSDVTLRNDDGEGVLTAALRIEDPAKRLGIFRWLLHAGASVVTPDKSGRDALVWAAFLNRTAEARVALDAAVTDIDVARVDKHGYTALHYAVFNNNPTICLLLGELFRRFSLSPDIPDRHLVTPYLHALRLGHSACAEAIHPRGTEAERTGLKDAFNVWTKIGELQGIRLAKAGMARGDGRPGTSISLPRGPRGRTPASDLPARHKTTRTQTLRRQQMLSKSAQKVSRGHGKSPGDAANVRTVSVKLTDLQPEITSKLSPREKRNENENTAEESHESSLPSPDMKHAYRNYFPTLFSLYADQQTGAILPPAAQRPKTSAMSFNAVATATKFAVLLRTRSKSRNSSPRFPDTGHQGAAGGLLGIIKNAKKLNTLMAKK